jgi:hypothetical protein
MAKAIAQQIRKHIDALETSQLIALEAANG